jgi:hypothetical protein
VQVPSDDVTTVLPSDVDDDMLVAPLPVVPDCTVMPFGPVVLPDTLPPPALTELFMEPVPGGGLSPGLSWTVLQLLFGLDDETEFLVPSDEAELDELLLSAWAATAKAATNATAPNVIAFMDTLLLLELPDARRCAGPRAPRTGHRVTRTP